MRITVNIGELKSILHHFQNIFGNRDLTFIVRDNKCMIDAVNDFGEMHRCLNVINNDNEPENLTVINEIGLLIKFLYEYDSEGNCIIENEIDKMEDGVDYITYFVINDDWFTTYYSTCKQRVDEF